MLTDLEGNPIELDTPPVGHSVSTALTPTSDQKGSTSPGGPSSKGRPNPNKPAETSYVHFLQRFRNQDRTLDRLQYKERLIEKVQRQLDAIDAYMSDEEVWYAKMEDAKLRDIVMSQSLLIERYQALVGQPSSIIGVQQQQKIDELLPVLMQTIKERGLTVQARERTVEVKTK